MSLDVCKPDVKTSAEVKPDLLTAIDIPEDDQKAMDALMQDYCRMSQGMRKELLLSIEDDQKAMDAFRQNYYRMSADMKNELLASIGDDVKMNQLKDISDLDEFAVMDIIWSMEGRGSIDKDFLTTYAHLSSGQLSMLTYFLNYQEVEKFCARELFDKEGNITLEIDREVLGWLLRRARKGIIWNHWEDLNERIIASWNNEIIDLYFEKWGMRAKSITLLRVTKWEIVIPNEKMEELKEKFIEDIGEDPDEFSYGMLYRSEQVSVTFFKTLSSGQQERAFDWIQLDQVTRPYAIWSLLEVLPHKRENILSEITADMFNALEEGMGQSLNLNTNEVTNMLKRWEDFKKILEYYNYIDEDGNIK